MKPSYLHRTLAVSAGLGAAGWLATYAPAAEAHIDVDAGGTHQSRASDSAISIKNSPCGVAGSTRGENIYTYRPGDTINIAVNEWLPHPGYFRIAFDVDGDDDFPIPTGTACEFGDADCMNHPNGGPGNEDYCSNDTVLLDHLDPHASADSKGTYTWSVKLPDVECENCTLQIIQMMNDFGPHDPSNYPSADIYYHCIDMTLSNDAELSGDVPVANNGMDCKAGGGGEPTTGGTGVSTGTDTGGTSGDGGTTTGGTDTGGTTGAVNTTGSVGTTTAGGGVVVTDGGVVLMPTADGGFVPVGEGGVVPPGSTTTGSSSSSGCQSSGGGAHGLAAVLLLGGLWLLRRRTFA